MTENDGDSFENDYDEEESEYGFSEPSSPLPEIPHIEDFRHRILSQSEVQELFDSIVQQFCSLSKLVPSIARLLLANNKWDVDRLNASYSSDPVVFLVSQHLLPATNQIFTPLPNTSKISSLTNLESVVAKSIPGVRKCQRSSKEEICQICYSSTDDQSEDLTGLFCGHWFCRACWVNYFQVSIDSGLSTDIHCMGLQCNLIVPGDFLLNLLTDPLVRDKYHKLSFDRMVRTCPSLSYCIGPDCPAFIHALESVKPRRIECTRCRSVFCLACNQPYHAPTSCDDIKRWEVEAKLDAGTAQFLSKYTKDCPGCKVCIEKSSGCNHMECSIVCFLNISDTEKMKLLFSHLHLTTDIYTDWRGHESSYNCNRYDQNQSSSRQKLQRYMFYYERWANHGQSLALEKQHRRKIEDLIDQKILQKQGTWIDWQCLLEAVGVLQKCRYTLRYTYPHAYYLAKEERKNLFEYQQALLESEVEELAWTIEHSEVPEPGKLQASMSICEKHRITLLEEFLPTVESSAVKK